MRLAEARKEARRRWGPNGTAWASRTATHGVYQLCVGKTCKDGTIVIHGIAPDSRGYEAAFEDATARGK
jgi:hypothetical protein